jgi:hypothetical protein
LGASHYIERVAGPAACDATHGDARTLTHRLREFILDRIPRR